jgi:hypothetical protein
LARGKQASSHFPLQEATGMDVAIFYNSCKEAEADNGISTPVDICRCYTRRGDKVRGRQGGKTSDYARCQYR